MVSTLVDETSGERARVHSPAPGRLINFESIHNLNWHREVLRLLVAKRQANHRRTQSAVIAQRDPSCFSLTLVL